MKKIFSFVLALVATMALNATTYYFAGGANGWNNRSTPFSGEGNVLTVTIAQLDGGFKVLADGGADDWHPQFAIDNGSDVEGVTLGGEAITLRKAIDGAEEANIKDIKVLGLGDHEAYKDAVITIDVTNPDAITCALTEGTKISTVDTYQLVGACTDNWSTAAAIQFEDVEGVLTANIPDLNGTFKIIMNRAWDVQWCSNGAGVEMDIPYTAVKDGGNIALANPFGGYKNAVMTLAFEGDNAIITLIDGEFYVTEDNWYFPGTVLGWNCDETTMFEPVMGAGKEKYEYLAAEFSGEFKVVYGVWMVEFGANEAGVAYPINEAVTLKYPAATGNASIEGEYQDVTITIVPDYEAVTVELTISAEATNLKNVEAAKKANKRIENGRIILYQGEARFDVLGNVVK